MLKQIVLVAGLPGSGKSTWSTQRFPDALLIDDISQKTKEPLGFIAQQLDQFDCTQLVLVDINFCSPDVLRSAHDLLSKVYSDVQFELFAFFNEPQACLDNVQQRKLQGDLREVDQAIRALTRQYRPRELSDYALSLGFKGAHLVPVHKPQILG